MKKLTILRFQEATGLRLSMFDVFPGRFFNTNLCILMFFLLMTLFPFFFTLGDTPVHKISFNSRGRLDYTLATPKAPAKEMNFSVGENGCCFLPDYEKALFELVNRTRREHNLPLYEQDRRLVAFAREKGEDMLSNGYFGHNSPRLGRPGQQASRHGLCFATYGENLAGTLEAKDMDPELAFNLLMDSEYHRNAILSVNKSHLGIGVVKGPKKGIVFVMHFLSP